jgi:hypothetical protein
MTASRTQRIFERNLAALARAQPALAERLAWPVDGAHVDPGPPARYLHHKAWVRLGVAEHESPAPPRGAAEALAIGVGTGDLLARALAALPGARVTAWDRDPWLLRLALERLDVAERIAAGGLVLALGTDLLDVGEAAWAARVVHPLLGGLYRRDVAFAEHARGARRGRRTAVLATGGLLVESLGDALERAGFRVWPLEIRRLSLEELDHQMARIAPELLVAVNYTNGLAELAARHGARLCAWEIDPTTTAPRLDAGVPGAAEAGIFTWRARDVAAFRAAGFEHPEHLPIGADTALRAPIELAPAERAHYAAPVSYVGASLMRNAGEFRARFLARWAETGRAGGDGEALLDEALFVQRSNPTRFVIPALLDRRAPGLRALPSGGEDPALLLGELAAAEKRLTYVANLGRLGAHAWGDAGWQPLERHGVRYRGPAGNGLELTKIYNATTVNVDVGRIYQNDIVTLRTFDVLACGAFALVEHTPELEQLFDVGREVVSYRTLPELLEKAEHYAGNPAEAARIAARGLAAVRERHTIDLRLAHMLRASHPRGRILSESVLDQD